MGPESASSSITLRREMPPIGGSALATQADLRRLISVGFRVRGSRGRLRGSARPGGGPPLWSLLAKDLFMEPPAVATAVRGRINKFFKVRLPAEL
eukprot:scaffold291130_cov25-Prasinocladus_malaysianus.AAC.1